MNPLHPRIAVSIPGPGKPSGRLSCACPFAADSTDGFAFRSEVPTTEAGDAGGIVDIPFPAQSAMLLAQGLADTIGLAIPAGFAFGAWILKHGLADAAVWGCALKTSE